MPKVLNKYRCTPAEAAKAICVMRPGKWGNRWSHDPWAKAAYRVKTRAEAVLAHRLWFLTSQDLEAMLLRDLARKPPEEGGLRGADVLCCCAPLPCHGEVYVEYANAPEPCIHLAAIKATNDLEG